MKPQTEEKNFVIADLMTHYNDMNGVLTGYVVCTLTGEVKPFTCKIAK